jgi:hypothetical protein
MPPGICGDFQAERKSAKCLLEMIGLKLQKSFCSKYANFGFFIMLLLKKFICLCKKICPDIKSSNFIIRIITKQLQKSANDI